MKNEKQYEALKDKGMSKERAAKIANSPKASSHGGKKSGLGRQREAGRHDGAEEGRRPQGRQGHRAQEVLNVGTSAQQRTVSDLVVDRLRAWGVPRVFGYSGDGVNGILGAFRRAGGDPRFVQARHEEAAAFMAVGHAKYTGGVGVVLATQGPGAVHLLNGLYDAKLDSQPVVAMMGQQQQSALGSATSRRSTSRPLVKDVAPSSRTWRRRAEQVPVLIDRAFRTALATRSPLRRDPAARRAAAARAGGRPTSTA